ncbi:hypothetical protein QWY90_07950 [Flavobacterium paronense]|uniref:Uncharacterized protein n=1 Tax=Flavobacterium paronense TaxID=1392775 RepID=A0ABV5GGZ5_9FLAO|nr:hypothetical protein [Flavobacterium paronense]MDN3675900.1 hypothetical protein [Flavobacterium paronense]MDN3675915.1 hypothetical protein [Flavobacterium paronense]MDN3677245.1 hypothetical protein [Flavobacterium paronense]
MKTIIVGAIAILFSLNIQSQNQNKKTETITKTTTVKDDKGEHVVVKKEEIKEIQNIKLQEVPSGTLNTNIQPTPTQATVTTSVNVDGQERVVDVDHSAYYSYNGEKYQVLADNSGYKVTNNMSGISLLRRTSNNNYIYKNKDKISVGHFDADGNLILETYDDKMDTITVEVFNLQK